MPKAKNVTVIPATLNIHTKTPTKERVRRRVAAYARVSTDSEEQLTSYEAQVDYYTKFIQENPDWDFVEVYTDEGISAVNTKRRDGFNRMIRDSSTGQRYIHHREKGSRVLLFVREFKSDRISGSAAAYTYLGTANYVKHDGEKPMNITWKLDHPIPAKYLKKTNKLVVG